MTGAIPTRERRYRSVGISSPCRPPCRSRSRPSANRGVRDWLACAAVASSVLRLRDLTRIVVRNYRRPRSPAAKASDCLTCAEMTEVQSVNRAILSPRGWTESMANSSDFRFSTGFTYASLTVGRIECRAGGYRGSVEAVQSSGAPAREHLPPGHARSIGSVLGKHLQCGNRSASGLHC